MATISKGGTLPDSANKTDFYTLVDSATISGIVNGDLSGSAGITAANLAQIATANKIHTDSLTDGTHTSGKTLYNNGTKWIAMTGGTTGSLQFVIDGGGEEIADGVAGDVQIPFACTITACRLLADQSGSIVVDIWKDTYANYPATDADTITASAVPTISGATKDEDTTLTGWTTSVTAGDCLRFNVDSCTTITRCTVILQYTRT